MRILATFALAVLTGTAVAATVENIIVRNGDHSYINGNVPTSSIRTFGKHFAQFELDGVRYVITDEATLEKIEKVMEPQVELGRQQAALGERQAALGAEQAKIGAAQARIGLQQASTRDEGRQHELGEKQRELAEKQAALGDRQSELGEKQRILGERQEELSARVEKELKNIFENAVKTGIAQRR